MVVLNPSSTALEAARAIENNNIGAVIVQERGSVVGIATDRDLTIRVVGRGLDAKTTSLGEVMTTPVLTLSSSDDEMAAIRLMRDRNVRRIPLVDGDKVVGLVTLDDLLLDEAAPLDELAAIVQAQIGEGGPATPAKSRAGMRRSARAEATYRRMLTQVQADAALETLEQAETVLEVVLSAVVRRLTPDEAKHLIAQLPSVLEAPMRALPPGPDKGISRGTIEADLVRRLDVAPARAAELLNAVGATIAQNVSSGQRKDVQGQLPDDLRRVFSVSDSPTASVS
jgi:uncharacterized protein (DUF2267 family)